MFEPPQLRCPHGPVAPLCLTDERDGRTRGTRTPAAFQRQHVDLVAGPVLAAGDGRPTRRTHSQTKLLVGVPGDPFGGQCLEVRAEDLGVDGVLDVIPNLLAAARFEVRKIRLDDQMVQPYDRIGDPDPRSPVLEHVAVPLDEAGSLQHAELVAERAGRSSQRAADLGGGAFAGRDGRQK